MLILLTTFFPHCLNSTGFYNQQQDVGHLTHLQPVLIYLKNQLIFIILLLDSSAVHMIHLINMRSCTLSSLPLS